jgi:hypothetical protein
VSRTFWEEYVRPESMIVDTLGVYCNYTVTCMCTRMIFAAVLSPTINIFHRHLGPNLYISQ